MSFAFDYKTLSITLNRQEKNCHLTLLNKKDFQIKLFLEELESFFDWLTNKIEISSVLIEPLKTSFNLWNLKEKEKFDQTEITLYLKLIQRLSWSQLLLPQTIIWKFNESVDFLGYELSSGSDIKIAAPSIHIKLNPLKYGITPTSGLCALLNKTTNHSKLKYYLMTSSTLSKGELIDLGLINVIQYGQECSEIIENISEQSPTARIQLKRSFNHKIIENIDDYMTRELNFGMATLQIQDWKRKIHKQDFLNPREVSKELKNLSLIQKENSYEI